MNLFLYLTIFASVTTVKSVQVVVTGFVEMEMYYLQLRQKGTRKRDPIQSFDDRQRADLCRRIIDTRYFRSNKLAEYVDKDESTVQVEIRSRGDALFHLHYKLGFPISPEESPAPKQRSSFTTALSSIVRCFSSDKTPPTNPPVLSPSVASSPNEQSPGLNYKAAYPYNSFHVQTPAGLVTEQTFPCLARTIYSRHLEQYFIGFGRKNNTWFVFHQNYKNYLVVNAVAEALPTLVTFDSQSELERHYKRQRITFGKSNDRPAASEVNLKFAKSKKSNIRHFFGKPNADKSICRLNEGEKLRICALVLNLSQYVEKIDFKISPISVERPCRNIEVSFRRRGLNEKYHETAIGCTGKKPTTQQPLTYYISLSYNDEHSVFVYQMTENNEYFLDNYVKDLTVLSKT